MTSKDCEPFLRHIRFPRFKNLSPDARIDFTYPITALIGPNGTNKTSILRALQACPQNYNIGDYWFDTPLDPIIDVNSSSKPDPNRYIHGYYTPSGYLAEVIKTRVAKTSRGADYFETSAPRTRDGMDSMPPSTVETDAPYRNKTRWQPINKHVVYIDFRQELPAYDILMSFNWRNQQNDPVNKKDRIRRGSPYVSKALRAMETEHYLWSKNRILEPAEELSSSELSEVSKILQRRYKSIKLVKHDYFNVEGYTAILETGTGTYSEAYAGSGEFAAVMLVRSISRAEGGSLIILDEPETSLHPGAQKELTRYLARVCKTKKHQVVLATHAPALVEELPDCARKLLDINPMTGRVDVLAQSAGVHEAFNRLGAKLSSNTVVVEDLLAKALVERAARTRGDDFLATLQVLPVPGGAESLAKRLIPVQSHLNGDCIVLLDGDQRPAKPLSSSEATSDASLTEELRKIKIEPKEIMRNGGNQTDTSVVTKPQRTILTWAYNHLGYLPSEGNPEELLIEMSGELNSDELDAKNFWLQKTVQSLGYLSDERVTADQILAEQERSLAKIPNDHHFLNQILDELDRLLRRSW